MINHYLAFTNSLTNLLDTIVDSSSDRKTFSDEEVVEGSFTLAKVPSISIMQNQYMLAVST